MNFLSSTRFLASYSGLLTLSFIGTVVYGAGRLHDQTFNTVTARRINIVEPDGTVRLTISNRADFPGAWNRGKEQPRPDRRDAAGMLFMSEEGTEQGGLIWGAEQLKDGRIENHVHLSMDQYEENQVFAIDAGQSGNRKFSQITLIDQGDYPIDEKRQANDRINKLPKEEQDKAWQAFFASHRHDVRRLVLGRAPDQSVGLTLSDGSGAARLVVKVKPDGSPVIEFLDRSGKVTKEISGE